MTNTSAHAASVSAVSQILGHKKATETLNTSAHLWADDEDRIVAAIDGGRRDSASGGALSTASVGPARGE